MLFSSIRISLFSVVATLFLTQSPVLAGPLEMTSANSSNTIFYIDNGDRNDLIQATLRSQSFFGKSHFEFKNLNNKVVLLALRAGKPIISSIEVIFTNARGKKLGRLVEKKSKKDKTVHFYIYQIQGKNQEELVAEGSANQNGTTSVFQNTQAQDIFNLSRFYPREMPGQHWTLNPTNKDIDPNWIFAYAAFKSKEHRQKILLRNSGLVAGAVVTGVALYKGYNWYKNRPTIPPTTPPNSDDGKKKPTEDKKEKTDLEKAEIEKKNKEETERLTAEKNKIEQDRVKTEKEKAEKLEAERVEKERLSKLTEEEIKEEAEAARKAKAKKEQEDNAAAEAARLGKEKKDKETETARLEKEQKDKEAVAARLKEEKRKQLAEKKKKVFADLKNAHDQEVADARTAAALIKDAASRMRAEEDANILEEKLKAQRAERKAKDLFELLKKQIAKKKAKEAETARLEQEQKDQVAETARLEKERTDKEAETLRLEQERKDQEAVTARLEQERKDQEAVTARPGTRTKRQRS